MKKFSLLALAAAGLLLGACSDKNVVENEQDSWTEISEGYMAIRINLPVSPTQKSEPTRAANDVFDDGLAGEYAVTDAALLLFGGSNETTATLQAAYDLGVGTGENFKATDVDVDNDNLTTAYLAVKRIESVPTGTNLYAMVCLNYKNVMTINASTHHATVSSTDVNGYTISQLQRLAVSGDAMFTTKDSRSYFFMTNAVLSKTAGGTASTPTADLDANHIFTLADVVKDNIKPTAAEAEAAPAAVVFVERAVAKATLWWDNTKKFKNGESDEVTISSVKWAIDNKEPTSFVVRNPNVKTAQNGSTEIVKIADYMAYSSQAVGSGFYYRFAGNTTMGETTTIIKDPDGASKFRTYWCVDPQYCDMSDPSAAVAPTGMVRANDATGLVEAATSSSDAYNAPQYCNENTFNVANQDYRNTTRALIEVTLAGGDFYNLNGSETRLTLADAASYIFKAVVEDKNFTDAIATSGVVTTSGTLSVATATKSGAGTTEDPYIISAKLTEDGTANDDIVLKAARNASTGQVEFTGFTINTSGTSSIFDLTNLNTALTTTVINNIKSNVNAAIKVMEFTDGKMYYAARFEHFASTAYERKVASGTAFSWAGALADGDLAPWNCWETDPTHDVPGPNGAYPDTKGYAEKNYLGRWGMVRNNWYDVQIEKFLKLGSPVIPSADVTTTDDNIEQYIALKIAVLSWAKRTQHWSF